jgi:hypothetical protein
MVLYKDKRQKALKVSLPMSEILSAALNGAAEPMATLRYLAVRRWTPVASAAFAWGSR